MYSCFSSPSALSLATYRGEEQPTGHRHADAEAMPVASKLSLRLAIGAHDPGLCRESTARLTKGLCLEGPDDLHLIWLGVRSELGG
jgi:hypothetical protein